MAKGKLVLISDPGHHLLVEGLSVSHRRLAGATGAPADAIGSAAGKAVVMRSPDQRTGERAPKPKQSPESMPMKRTKAPGSPGKHGYGKYGRSGPVIQLNLRPGIMEALAPSADFGSVADVLRAAGKGKLPQPVKGRVVVSVQKLGRVHLDEIESDLRKLSPGTTIYAKLGAGNG
jgi:hypothetical protein